MRRVSLLGLAGTLVALTACQNSEGILGSDPQLGRVGIQQTGNTRITVELGETFEFCSLNGDLRISGEVTVENTGSHATEGLDVWVELQGKNPPGQPTFTTFASTANLAPGELGSGASDTYPFTIDFDPSPWTQFKAWAFGDVTNRQGGGWPLQSPSDDFELPAQIEPCVQDLGCTRTQGYWKNHEEAWPVTELMLGDVSYTQAQLLSILNQPVQGNGLVSLAHQLIAAKLNVANGADDTDVAQAIQDADDLIDDLVVPPVGNGSLAPSAVEDLVQALDDYNNGITGPGHCDDEE